MKIFILSIATLLFIILPFSNKSAAQTQPQNNAQLSDFTAIQKGNTVQLSWNVTNETNVASHQIQKSTNGSSFINIGSVVAQNNVTPYNYTFLDATPVAGNNYYRLSTIDKNGKSTYSNVLQVNNGFGRTDLQVLSNPVHGGVLNLQLSNINSGKYFISLYSNNGQKVFARSLDLTDGSVTETINVPQNLSHGLYFLQFANNEMRINKEIILQ